MGVRPTGVRARHALAHGLAVVALASTGCFAGAARAAELPRLCDTVFVETTDAAFRGLAHLVFRLHYTTGKLAFGTDPVACSVHSSQVGTTGSFTADDAAGTLDVDLSRNNGLLPYPLVVCTPRGSEDAETTALTVDVLEAQDSNGLALASPPVVNVETFECSGSTTTLPTTTLPVTTTLASITTTTAVATTSTIAVPPLCGDGDGNGAVTAADALLALRKAVGAASCPVERCDTDADGSVTAADALRILRAAVGIPAPLTCT